MRLTRRRWPVRFTEGRAAILMPRRDGSRGGAPDAPLRLNRNPDVRRIDAKRPSQPRLRLCNVERLFVTLRFRPADRPRSPLPPPSRAGRRRGAAGVEDGSDAHGCLVPMQVRPAPARGGRAAAPIGLTIACALRLRREESRGQCHGSDRPCTRRRPRPRAGFGYRPFGPGGPSRRDPAWGDDRVHRR